MIEINNNNKFQDISKELGIEANTIEEIVNFLVNSDNGKEKIEALIGKYEDDILDIEDEIKELETSYAKEMDEVISKEEEANRKRIDCVLKYNNCVTIIDSLDSKEESMKTKIEVEDINSKLAEIERTSQLLDGNISNRLAKIKQTLEEKKEIITKKEEYYVNLKEEAHKAYEESMNLIEKYQIERKDVIKRNSAKKEELLSKETSLLNIKNTYNLILNSLVNGNVEEIEEPEEIITEPEVIEEDNSVENLFEILDEKTPTEEIKEVQEEQEVVEEIPVDKEPEEMHEIFADGSIAPIEGVPVQPEEPLIEELPEQEEVIEQPVEEKVEEQIVEEKTAEPTEAPQVLPEEMHEIFAEEKTEEPVIEQPAEEKVEQPAEEKVEQPKEEAALDPEIEALMTQPLNETPVEEPKKRKSLKERRKEKKEKRKKKEETEVSVEQPIESMENPAIEIPAEQPIESMENPAIEIPAEQPIENPVTEVPVQNVQQNPVYNIDKVDLTDEALYPSLANFYDKTRRGEEISSGKIL